MNDNDSKILGYYKDCRGLYRIIECTYYDSVFSQGMVTERRWYEWEHGKWHMHNVVRGDISRYDYCKITEEDAFEFLL